MLDFVHQIRRRPLSGRLFEVHIPFDPLQESLDPGMNGCRRTLAMAKQILGQTMASPQFVPFRGLAVPNQIAKHFMICVGNPDTGEVARTEASGKDFRVTTIGLDPVACLFGMRVGAMMVQGIPSLVSCQYRTNPVGPAS